VGELAIDAAVSQGLRGFAAKLAVYAHKYAALLGASAGCSRNQANAENNKGC
jgi:electron transfer flavoprotein alpha subunit